MSTATAIGVGAGIGAGIVLMAFVLTTIEGWVQARHRKAQPSREDPSPGLVGVPVPPPPLNPWQILAEEHARTIARLEALLSKEQDRSEKMRADFFERDQRLREEFYHLVDARFVANLEWARSEREKETPVAAATDKVPRAREDSNAGLQAGLYAGGHLDTEEEERLRFHPEDEEEISAEEEADRVVQQALLQREQEKVARASGQGA